MNLLYLILYAFVLKNSSEVRQGLKNQLIIIRANEVRSLLPSISLKLSMMNKYFWIVNGYFLYELIVNGLIPTIMTNSDEFNPVDNVMQQVYDLLIIVALLFVLRPRVWPEFFSVGLLDAPFGEADGNIEMEERRLAPLLQTVIDEKAFNSMKSNNQDKSQLSSYSFNS